MKILIVEDERELAKSIVQYLRQESYVCEVAYSAQQATEKIALHDYDCILLDINLPDGNGLTVFGDPENRRESRWRNHYLCPKFA